MSNTAKRILATIMLLAILWGIVVLESHGYHATRWVAVLVVLGMILEVVLAIKRAPNDLLKKRNNTLIFVGFLAWLLVVLAAAYCVGVRQWIMLLLLMIISAADIGAWFFGSLFGNDKLWERISPNKTWVGQIAGIMCGTAASVLYGMLGTDTFLPQLLWIGISVSLLSQYGDLTTSWIKRHFKLKDFGSIIPGHGGFLDRFDGWIYALPLIWFIMM
ncbi:MAG: phosphatidate cytidylyltransferase [Alphaproteobacteria bacterium]|nr:phosphatidate cytidylyltransferase [Alphaproteobacteria bacterium]